MKQPKHKRSKAQVAASHKWAAAGRAAQASARAASIRKTGKPPARSKAQHQASLRWAAAGRASQERKRHHLKPLPRKQPALALPGYGIHDLPVCGPVAIAEHLLMATGVYATDAEIMGLAARAPDATLSGYLEVVAADGLAGVRLAQFWRSDGELAAPGVLYGVQFRTGYHAVVLCGGGMISWGRLLPVYGRPLEAWGLNWEHDPS